MDTVFKLAVCVMQISCLSCYPAFKMEEIFSSETSIDLHRTEGSYILEEEQFTITQQEDLFSSLCSSGWTYRR
jgi:hypothetical protein